jgi:uncharacterized membrane protein YtjA (UPF0391 family)
MISLSLGFLVIALLAALLGLGEDTGTATQISKGAFAVSLALFVWSLIAHCRRRYQNVAGRESDR